MTLAVVLVAEQHVDLVLGRGLPGQTERLVDVEVVLVSRTGRIGRVKQRPLQLVVVETREIARGNPPAQADEIPQLVLAERTARASLDVIQRLDVGPPGRAARTQCGIQVVALQLRAAVVRLEHPVERVPAFTRDRVDLNATGFRRRGARRLHGRLGNRRRVHAACLVAAGEELVVVQAVAKHDHVGGVAAVNAERLRILAADPADVAIGGDLRRRRYQRGKCRRVAGEWNGIPHLAGDGLLRLRRRVHVDERGLTGNGDRFRDRAELHLGVDGCRERRGQFDARSLERGEALQREGDGVRARAQVHDPEDALGIGDGGADLFYECRTSDVHLDARKNGARGVFDDTGDAALGRCGDRQQEKPQR